MTIPSSTQLGAKMVSAIWGQMLPSYGAYQTGSNAMPVHIPEVFDQAWLTSLPLPTGDDRPEKQGVTLMDGGDFQRPTRDTAENAYRERPRTRVYEGVSLHSGGWYAFAALQLAHMARCRVVSSIFVSNAGDATIPPHVDAWYGVIVQMHGAKLWTLTPEGATESQNVLTRAGDMLLLPPSVRHAVATPDHSTHMVFAFGESIT